MTSDRQRVLQRHMPTVLCAVAGVALFHFFGNANRGYIATDSLFVWWGTQWMDAASETEHGWLILALSFWLFWRNLRHADRGPLAIPGYGGAEQRGAFERRVQMAFIGALLIHGLGYYTQQARISIAGLLLFAWAWLALAGGRRWARAGVFPVAILAFAIPLNFLDTAGFSLRLLVVRSAGGLADWLGWPVLIQGTRLLDPSGIFHYEVDAACAGVRSLVAILALSLILGYIRLGPFWARSAVVLSSLPLTYAANVARLLAIVAAGRAWGQEAGRVVHDMGGYVVFVAVVGAVHGICVWLERLGFGDGGGATADAKGTTLQGEETCEPEGKRRPIAVVALLGCAVMAVALGYGGRHLPEARADILLTADGRAPVELPAFPPGDWIGKRAEVGLVERQILPSDTGFSRRIYVSPQAPEQVVLLSIVLSGRDRSSIHRPELCLVGQGWSIAESGSHRFRHPAREHADFDATTLRLEFEGGTGDRVQAPSQMAAYWFVGGGRVVRTHWERMVWDVWARVRGDPIRWAYVLMMTPAPDGEEEAFRRMQRVLDSVLAAFQPPLER